MTQTDSNPSSPPSSTPSTRPWIILILVVVVLCCFCIGAIGLALAFGGPILNELGLYHTSLLPLMR